MQISLKFHCYQAQTGQMKVNGLQANKSLITLRAHQLWSNEPCVSVDYGQQDWIGLNDYPSLPLCDYSILFESFLHVMLVVQSWAAVAASWLLSLLRRLGTRKWRRCCLVSHADCITTTPVTNPSATSIMPRGSFEHDKLPRGADTRTSLESRVAVIFEWISPRAVNLAGVHWRGIKIFDRECMLVRYQVGFESSDIHLEIELLMFRTFNHVSKSIQINDWMDLERFCKGNLPLPNFCGVQ